MQVLRRENSRDLELEIHFFMDLKKTTIFCVILSGASAMASQIVFMREFLIVFYGNEISVGIILASWLLWGAFGSAFLGYFSDRIKNKPGIFALSQFFLSFILPFTLIFMRGSKSLMGISTGEIIGFSPMIFTSFLVLFLPCAIMGFLFSLACRIYHDSSENPEESVARVYILEAVGSLTGGLLVSYFLIRFMNATSILFILFFFNMLASYLMQRHSKSYRGWKILKNATLITLIVLSILFIFGGGKKIRDYSLGRLWSGYDLIASKDSVYGNITITGRERGLSFYENGLHLYTVPDLLSSEEAVHFALLEHEKPGKVLLIGGGIGGLLAEVLKHPVEEVDYVELDPTMIEMAKRYLPASESSILDSPKVEVITGDGRFYVKRTRNKYDVIIISLGDPYTAQINRFYTVEFFRELARVLDEGGVISFSLTSSENYISDELQNYLGSIYSSLKEVFPEVLIVPGDTIYLLASNVPGVLTAESEFLSGRVEERGLNTKYVRDYYLFDKLSSERVEYANSVISSKKEIEVNTDFKPISYYYATVFWSTHFDVPIIRRLLQSVSSENIWMTVSFFCFILLFLNLVVFRRRRTKNSALIAVMTTGFAEINFQIAVILSFQVIYGYVFYKLGIIITSFMVGLALGGWIIARGMKTIKDDVKVFTWTQVSICVYPLILPVIFLWLSRTESEAVSWLGANIIFPFLPIIAGIIGGVQFPLANRIYRDSEDEMGRVAGLSYGLDLFGACMGAFIAAAFLIPVLGIFGTCLLVALINVTVLSLLLLE